MTDGMWVAHGDRAEKKPTILLVDDAPGIRLMVSLSLRACGFEIVEASTTQLAISTLEREEAAIDLVIGDVSSGSTIDGLRLLRWLAQRRPDLPLLLTSSDANKAQEARKLSPHATILAKPYCIDKVTETTCALLSCVCDAVYAEPMPMKLRSVL